MAGGRFSFKASGRPVSDLVATQEIRTDGEEERQLHFAQEESGIRVGASVHYADAGFVFENFEAFQAGKPMPPLVEKKVTRFKPNLKNPLVKKRRENCRIRPKNGED